MPELALTNFKAPGSAFATPAGSPLPSGPVYAVKDAGQTSYYAAFAGVETVLFGPEVDLKVVADVTITFPAGVKFWIVELGLIATVIDTLTVQPTIRFGITGTLAKHLAAVQTTLITAAGKRATYTPLVPQDGETSLTFGVTVGATATTAKGRPYWKGLLVEDE